MRLAVLGWIPVIGLCAASPVLAAAQTGVSDEAAEAIGLIESDDAYKHQLGFLRLEALRDPATIPFVRRFLRHEEPDLRALSVRALAAIEGSPAIPDVLEALARDRHPAVRRAALLGIEPFEAANPDVLPAMLTALRDPHPEVRVTAVDAVSRVDHGLASEAILERRRREHDRNVRRAIELAVKRLAL